MTNQKAQDISYEIVEHLGVIQSRTNGWNKEVNLIRWNDTETPKFDIRSWSPNHEHMARGVTLYADEMREVVRLYQNWKHNETVRQKEEERAANTREYRKQMGFDEASSKDAVAQAEAILEARQETASQVAECAGEEFQELASDEEDIPFSPPEVDAALDGMQEACV